MGINLATILTMRYEEAGFCACTQVSMLKRFSIMVGRECIFSGPEQIVKPEFLQLYNSFRATRAVPLFSSFKEALYDDVCPPSSAIHLAFPSDERKVKEIKFSWFDGGIRPQLPEGLATRTYLAREDGNTGRKKLFWDGDTMKITNYDYAN